MNKIFFGLLLTTIFFVPHIFGGNLVYAGTDNNNEINFFYSTTCSHCFQADKFLKELEAKYPEIKIKKYEISKNVELVKRFYEEYNVPSQEQGYVPIVFTANNYFLGFNEQIAKEIESCIKECLVGTEGSKQQEIQIPFLGQIDIEKVSIPLLAVTIGFFDGFNVCSLGALVLILGLVIALKSKKKILFFGGIFIIVTILVYWALVFLWHRLFVFISPYVRSMEIIIGLLAGWGAWYFLKEYLKSRKGGLVCKFGGFSENLSRRVQDVFEKKSGILMMISAILFFAVAVTVIEFPCSAIFPVLFTGILARAGVSLQMSLLYIGLYVFFYMLDEIIVLLIAVFTMKIWVASPKFIIWLNFFATIMLVFFSFYYLLWPFISGWF